MKNGKLTGQVAVVTGASQGIGQATAIALARAGADVIGSYRPHGDEQERASAAETVAVEPNRIAPATTSLNVARRLFISAPL